MAHKVKPLAQQEAESNAMLAARDAAMQTPEEVRKAFLARRRACGPVYIEPFNAGILLLCEELQHPLHTGGEPLLDDELQIKRGPDGKPLTKPLTMRQIAQAIFIFHDSEAAAEELASGVEAFDAAAFTLFRSIDPQELAAITSEIVKTYQEGLATIPGGGESNPTGTGC